MEARRAYLKLSSWIWISKQWYQDISRSTITHLGKVGVKPNWMTLDTYVLGSGCIKPSRSHGMLLARLVIVGTDYRDGEATSLWIIYYSSHHNSPGYRIVPCSSIILFFYYSTLFCFSLSLSRVQRAGCRKSYCILLCYNSVYNSNILIF